MGLGAPKRRSKISSDPNNTTWSRSTETFGHKILSRHGWTPGSYLGAEDATHSGHYTAANASHIRVLLREENLGLGAKIGGTSADTFGLSLFSGVLGRLNGKSEDELQKQQDALRDAELKTYCERKYGLVGFVRGGWLVGDKMKAEQDELDEDNTTAQETRVQKKSKKRKVEDDQDTQVISERRTKKHKKTKQDHAPRKSETIQATTPETEEQVEPEQDRVSKQQTKSSGLGKDGHERLDKKNKKHDHEHRQNREQKAGKESAAREDAKLSKQERRARKEERRKRKEEKAARKTRKVSAVKDPEVTISDPSDTTKLVPVVQADVATPSTSNRHAFRHRYIQQKRMASMDPNAMKEIFMLTGAA